MFGEVWSRMKVILHCSKCFKNYPADLTMVWEWDDGFTYQYETKCLSCGVNLECVVSEIEEVPTQGDMVCMKYNRGNR